MKKLNVFGLREFFGWSWARKAAWVAVAAVLTSGVAQGVTIEPIFRFLSAASPQCKLLDNGDGTFYGTTSAGGASGLGTVFVVNTAGALTTLATFTGANGANPYSELTRGTDGNLYGTTLHGGSAGFGTVFRMTPAGALTTLVSFTKTNGERPFSGLALGADGNFYGVTFAGGAKAFGTVFKVTPAGLLTTLASFSESNGSYPDGTLTLAPDGFFYGTTSAGGKSGAGTFFRVSPAGALTSLFSFSGINGSAPFAGVIQGNNGNFFGTTSAGGQRTNGVIFEITSNGTIVRTISLDATIGSHPSSKLLQGSDGNFYGTAFDGGALNFGSVFQMKPDGSIANLASFQVSICAYPAAGLIQTADGFMYGTSSFGGFGSGAIYRFSLAASPTAPVLAITAPQANDRFTNAAVTATGTAQGSAGVDAVWWKLNDGGWTKAATSDSWAHWSAPLTLVAAANTLSAYAVDPSGNASGISTVSFIYSGGGSTNALTLLTSGSGKIVKGFIGTPVIGKTYTVTAVPAAGFSFVGWSGDVTSTKPKIAFVMQPFLTLVATFRDTSKPIVAITSPRVNVLTRNPSLTFSGTAKDNAAIQSVNYQVNGAGWQPIPGSWNTWSIPLSLTPGSNVFAVQAVDSSGNLSTVVQRSAFYQVTSTLTVSTNGPGRITPVLNGMTLDVGRAYKLTAIPASGSWVFKDWTGSITSGVAALTFLMQSNMTLQASFVTNPFPPIVGVYNGLFISDTNSGVKNSGYFTLALLRSGAFSGRVLAGGAAYSFSGLFNGDGVANGVMARSGRSILTLDLQVNFAAQQITGTVNNGSLTAPLAANRNVFSAVNRATNFAGKYTMVIPGSADTTVSPGGNGVGTITIDTLGNILFSGNLADGTVVSQKTTISSDGLWPLFVGLYGGKGLILSWASFATNSSAPSGDLLWINSGNATRLYRSGFTNLVPISGSPYVFTNGTPVLNLTNGVVTLTGGNLSSNITSSVTWGANNIVTVDPSGGKVAAKLIPASGAVAGAFFNPQTRKNVPFQAVVLENQNIATGNFVGASQSGLITIQNR